MRRFGAVAVAIACVATGCSASGSPAAHGSQPATARPTVSQPPVAPVRWKGCGGGFVCGTVGVPRDYSVAGSPLLNVAVARRPASDPAQPVGVLVIDFGGPGISGAATLKVAASLLPKPLLDHFDLVSFDPRGSGQSAPLRCDSVPGGAPLVSAAVGAPPLAAPGQPLPVSAVYRRVYTDCSRTDSALLPALGSAVQARDLDRIRAAIGATQLRYLGLSYGSVLGLAYAQQFPKRVAAMVLDSPVDPTEPLTNLAREQAAAAEQALSRAFNSQLPRSAEQQYDALAHRLAVAPLPPPGHGDATPVSLGDLEFATLTYLQLPTLTPDYPAALTSALHGDGTHLRALASSQFEDVDGASVLGTYWATVCGDAKERQSPVALNTASRALAAKYPRLGAIAYAFSGGACSVWPPATEPVALPTGRLPIAVVGGTGDAVTPYATAERLQRELPGSTLVTFVGGAHTLLAAGSSKGCLAMTESRFLLNPAAVPRPVRCTDSPQK